MAGDAVNTILAEARQSRLTLAAVDGDQVPLILRPARLPQPHAIPPREWLYGTQLIRGFVTVLVAPGGTGKSAYAMAIAAALASGKKLLDVHIFARVNVVVLNLEDPMDELERRLAAIMIKHDLTYDDLSDRYFLHSGEDRRITMACLDDDGFTVVHPDESALIAEIQAHQIGLIIVDPFAESHSLEENNNPQMVKAAAAWRRVARTTGCAVLLVHHVRKGAVTDIDSARGAKALTDSARVGLLLSPMSPDDGELLNIPEPERWQYVRLDNAKANMAPKAGRATWLRLAQVELGNATRDYPNGDHVAAVVSWDPPSVIRQASVADLNRVLDVIDTPPAPWLYTPNRTSKNSARWAGNPIMETLGCNETQAQSIINQWLRTGLLEKATYHDTEQRKERAGVRVVASKRPQ